MFSLLSEVYFYYGKDVSCEGILSFPFEKDSQPVTMDATRGLVIGNDVHGLTTNIKLMCASNATATKELAVDLTTGLHIVANFTWDDFTFWAKLSDAKMMNTQVTSPVVELDYHNWNAELTAVVVDMADEFNLRFGTPIDLKQKATVIHFVAGIIRQTLISPFVKDEFLFAGFKMITDRNAESPSTFLQ